MCPTYREVRLIQSNLSELSDKLNMEIDKNPTKPTKCVRLIDKYNLSVVRLTKSWLYLDWFIYIYKIKMYVKCLIN